MTTIRMKHWLGAVGLAVAGAWIPLTQAAQAAQAAPAQGEAAAAAEPAANDLEVNHATSLDELLKLVQQRRLVESKENAAREQRFAADKANQAKMLASAKATRAAEEQRSEKLETKFEENEIHIGDLQEQLQKRLGSLSELFGVLQQVAGDTRSQFEGSVISAQFPGRGKWLGEFAKKMGTSSQLASIDEMERLWFELQREMTESGKVVRFPAKVNMLSGEQQSMDVVRVGSFNLIGNDQYLGWQPDVQQLVELPRQPASQYTNTVENLLEAKPGEIVPFAVDPTRGSLLALLIQASTWGERFGSPLGGIMKGECYLPFCSGQGGTVGAVIILLGILGILLSLERLFTLWRVGARVNAQKESNVATDDNPLGRVLKVYENNKDVDVETLELKLSEGILAEAPGLTRNITLIQVISVVAPLLGLLGTVIGMILTFQAITLFGTGDPKTMASGISIALMTTVEGLVVAIPMVLLHSLVNARSKSIIHILEEQTAGLIAEQAEKAGKALG
jgi:biopolymer transport protein ExbB